MTTSCQLLMPFHTSAIAQLMLGESLRSDRHSEIEAGALPPALRQEYCANGRRMNSTDRREVRRYPIRVTPDFVKLITSTLRKFDSAPLLV